MVHGKRRDVCGHSTYRHCHVADKHARMTWVGGQCTLLVDGRAEGSSGNARLFGFDNVKIRRQNFFESATGSHWQPLRECMSVTPPHVLRTLPPPATRGAGCTGQEDCCGSYSLRSCQLFLSMMDVLQLLRENDQSHVASCFVLLFGFTGRLKAPGEISSKHFFPILRSRRFTPKHLLG